MSLTVSQDERDSLFSGFILMIKQPELFHEERMLAEHWLADPRNHRELRPFSVEEVLEQAVLPEKVYDLLKSYHDDYVEEMPEEILEQYRKRQMPHVILGQE